MDWQKAYDTVIKNAQKHADVRVRNRRRNNFHIHHIFPSYLGGAHIEKRELKEHEPHKELVILTYREHYIAHLALFCLHEKNRSVKLSFGYCHVFGGGSSRKYARWMEAVSHNVMTEQHREAIRQAAFRRKDRFEHAKKMHEIQKSKPITFKNRKRPKPYKYTMTEGHRLLKQALMRAATLIRWKNKNA